MGPELHKGKFCVIYLCVFRAGFLGVGYPVLTVLRFQPEESLRLLVAGFSDRELPTDLAAVFSESRLFAISLRSRVLRGRVNEALLPYRPFKPEHHPLPYLSHHPVFS